MLKNIKGNIFGGITAGVIALPLALAFGVSSGLGAVAGLYGAIFLCFFATLFGGTPTQISGPTGPITVVIASLVLLHPDNPALVFATICLSGLFQIVFSFLSIGQMVRYVPYPVISGFMSGIGVIIILLQLNAFLGLEFSGPPIEHLLNVFKHFKEINTTSILLGAFTLAIVLFTPKTIAKKIPSTLFALIIGTTVSVVLNLDLKTIGDIPRSLPSFALDWISFKELQTIIPLALTLALIGSIDSLLTSLVADSLTRTKHNPNKELFGQGISNIITGMFGGLGGCGAAMRTIVNIKAGGSSRLSGIVYSIFLVMIVLFFAPLVSNIPLTILAAILFKVGIDIIDYRYLKIWRVSTASDLVVMGFVLFLTVFDDLIFAVGVGIVLSAILLAAKLTKQFEISLTHPDELINEYFEEDDQNRVMFLKIRGVFFFGSASLVMSRAEEIMEDNCIIIDCQRIKSMDTSAVFALQEMIMRLKSKKDSVILLLNNSNLAAHVLKMGLIEVMPRENLAISMKTALKKAKNRLAARR